MPLIELLWAIPVLLIPACVYLSRLPFMYRNGDLFFAVTVGREFPDTPEGIAIARRYRGGALRYGLFWIAITWLVALWGCRKPIEIVPALAGVTTVVSSLGFSVGQIILIVRARKRTLPHAVQPTLVHQPTLDHQALPLPQRPLWSGALAAAAIAPFFLSALAAFYLRYRWAEIPAKFPIHWNAHGQVDSWGEKSFQSVFLPMIIGGFLTAFLIGMISFLAQQKGQMSAAPAVMKLEWGVKRGLLVIVVACSWLLCALVAAFSVTVPFNQSEQLPRLPMTVLAIGLPAFLLPTVGWAVWLTRAFVRESRLNAEAAPAGVIGDGAEDRFWKWGMFYYNPDDASVWVRRRMGAGWTVNLARRQVWVWLLVVLVVPIAIAAIIALVEQ